jgi:hypothetical protein
MRDPSTSMLSMPAAPASSVNPQLTQEITGEITEARSGLGTLVRAFASSLVLEPVSDPEPAPVVYTAAIHTSADLVSSLIGITELSRDQGFSRHPETIYGDGGRNATYHVDHSSLPMSLSVNCNPLRQTVAIAVSGLDSEETLRCFQALELALFGSC